jgi:hypothetical protein
VICRRVERDDLTPGLAAIAVKSDDRITVVVSESIPARLQRAGGRSALRAARRAGWTRNPVPAALLLFTAASLWRAALASGARRFAVAGFAALILAITIGVVLTGPAQSPPVRAVITPVTASGTPHVRGATKPPRDAQTPGSGRARVVAHQQSQGTPTRSARASSSGATPTAGTSTPTGSSPGPEPSSSPDPSPSPSPTKKKHCIILLLC